MAASAAGAVDGAPHASGIIMLIVSNIVHIALTLKRGPELNPS